jgi:hypothetical protein
LVEATTDAGLVDMPRADELLGSVVDFLRQQVMAETTGRTQFLARVASNSLDIVQREMALGSAAAAQELSRLQNLLNSTSGDLIDLRWQLVKALREGAMDLNVDGLTEHLRASIVNQINIDQPRYPGLATALNGGVGV